MFKCKQLTITHNDITLVDISFDVVSSLALIGESGSGKSLTLKALLGLLPRDMEVVLEVDSSFELINGKTLSFVPQNPFTALSPLTKIKKQFFNKRAKERLESVGLGVEILDRYPPELSGGQLQRVLLAMAISEETKLLLLDEPTTALDLETKNSMLLLLEEMRATYGFKLLFVTHDISSVEDVCDSIALLKKGSIVESGSMSEFLDAPQTKYGRVLLESNFLHRKFRL